MRLRIHILSIMLSDDGHSTSIENWSSILVLLLFWKNGVVVIVTINIAGRKHQSVIPVGKPGRNGRYNFQRMQEQLYTFLANQYSRFTLWKWCPKWQNWSKTYIFLCEASAFQYPNQVIIGREGSYADNWCCYKAKKIRRPVTRYMLQRSVNKSTLPINRRTSPPPLFPFPKSWEHREGYINA